MYQINLPYSLYI